MNIKKIRSALCTALCTAFLLPICTGVLAEEQPRQAPVSDDSHIVLTFVGDCSIGDNQAATELENSYTQTVKREGWAYPFSLIDHYLKEDDLTFANLEAVLTTQRRLYNKSKRYNLIAAPEHVNILLEGSIEVVNTVNNHCQDFGQPGYEDALQVLDEAGIGHFGTFAKSDVLWTGEVKGIRIGAVGYSYPQDYDIRNCLKRIKKLRDEGCDLVIVSMHWGREENHKPIGEQFSFAKKLIDGGADLIWGHHTHVTQPVMFYKGKPVMFSTGNFTFGSMSQVDPATGIFQLEYTVDKGKPVLDMLRVVPCETGEHGDYRPFELKDEEARRKCLKILIGSSKSSGFVRLPDSFAETGIVYIDKDGSFTEN